MTAANSSAVAEDFFHRCFRGDIAAAVALLDPKVVFRVPGSHQLAGSFEGPRAVTGHIEELLRHTHHTLDVLKWEDWMIGINNLAGLLYTRAQREGVIATFRVIFLVTMSGDDRIRRIETFFSDQAEAERFFG